MLEEPGRFDEVVSQYVNMWDRNTWPLAHRSMLIGMAKVIPTYYIDPENLTDDMKRKRLELGPIDDAESVQEALLSQE